jgi:hypothetical protein
MINSESLGGKAKPSPLYAFPDKNDKASGGDFLKEKITEFGDTAICHDPDLPPVVVPSFKLVWGSSQARDPGGA